MTQSSLSFLVVTQQIAVNLNQSFHRNYISASFQERMLISRHQADAKCLHIPFPTLDSLTIILKHYLSLAS